MPFFKQTSSTQRVAEARSDATPASLAGKAKTLSPARRAFYVCLYILGLLLLVEGTARLTWRVLDITWGLVVPQDIARFDPVYGWSLVPGASSESKATGRVVRYTINAKGLRGPEVPYDKPAGVYRVVFLGDSHTFGFGIPERFRFSSIMEGYFPGLESVNMGVSGYGIDQEMMTLVREGLKYRPDMVIVYVPHFDDMRHMKDKMWDMGKPRFQYVDGRLVPTNLPVANNDWLHVTALDTDRFLSHWSRAYLMLRDAAIHFTVTKEQLFEGKPDAAVRQETERLGEIIIDNMARICADHGVKFVLVSCIEALTRHCGQVGIPALNVNAAVNTRPLYLAYDPTEHPNEAANGILAWEIASFLKSRHLVPDLKKKPDTAH